ncbi:hypothetical protein B0H21DRAFT_732616 [Amylocystis lapponica]|nr:hypothetical protein B0H21DRAFT_732616 [Amylocystis lapponica]
MRSSSSRNALKRAHTGIASVPLEVHGAPQNALIRLHDCLQQRHAHAVPQASRQPFRQRSGDIRHGPYAFQPDSGFRGAAPLTPWRASQGRMRNLFVLCRKMKAEGVAPDLTTYSYVLRAAHAAFEDMLALGLYPNRNLFHYLLHSVRHLDSSHMWDILESMQGFDISPNEITYEVIVTRFADAGHLELALRFLSELGERGLSPTLKTAQSIILAAGRLEAFEQTSVRRLDSEVWVECLVSSSEALYSDGVLRAWQKVVHELKITPDEGCCIQVLHTAGRHGHSTLGLDALRILDRIGAAWKEYHFAPLVEAFCREKNIKEALGTLQVIRSHDITPVAETAYPIFQAIRDDPDAVDEAWGHLESLHEEGKQIDVTALNVIIQASVGLGTCSGRVAPRTGDRLLAEMKQARLKPDTRTYERLLMLCLTQSTYEDAFFYLEEMKGEGHVPPLTVYEAIVRKCVSVGDTRYKLAVEELVECGYEVSSTLDTFINSGGEHGGVKEPEQFKAPSHLSKGRTAWLQEKKIRNAQKFAPNDYPELLNRRP